MHSCATPSKSRKKNWYGKMSMGIYRVTSNLNQINFRRIEMVGLKKFQRYTTNVRIKVSKNFSKRTSMHIYVCVMNAYNACKDTKIRRDGRRAFGYAFYKYGAQVNGFNNVFCTRSSVEGNENYNIVKAIIDASIPDEIRADARQGKIVCHPSV